jgi:peptidoglycan/LPS O-acetylase OafA/YrhL
MTVVLVVLYHVIFMYNGVQTSLTVGPFHELQYQDIYLYLVYPWFMLLLFVVSGMSARFYLEHHSNKDFIKARTVKLLVPSTLGLFVFQWIQGYYSMAITNAFESIPAQVPGVVKYLIMALSGQGVLWFAQLLWFFSLILVCIKKIEKDKLYHLCEKANIIVLLLLTVVIYGSSLILNVPLVTVFRVGIYLLGYLIGYFILSHDEVMNKLSKWWGLLVPAALVLAVFFTYIYFGQDYTAHAVLDTPLCNAFAWITILAIFAVMNQYGNFENAFSKWMNKKSWGLYVFHYLVISAAAYYLKLYCNGLPSVFIYLITAVVAFAGAFVLYEIISRIPVVRWCVLGIRKRKT